MLIPLGILSSSGGISEFSLEYLVIAGGGGGGGVYAGGCLLYTSDAADE